jgi:hypothetical protein
MHREIGPIRTVVLYVSDTILRVQMDNPVRSGETLMDISGTILRVQMRKRDGHSQRPS